MKTSTLNAPVWINANPSFKQFDNRIVRYLSCHVPIAYWEYVQELDEASSLEVAQTLLHDYLKSRPQPVDLLGHGTGGLLALMYARKHPQRVRSLTLLGVSSSPGSDWQTHYYQMRKLLPCSQEILLARMVQMMFGEQNLANTRNLIKVLRNDLYTAPTSHSLLKLDLIASGGVAMPLMVCGSRNDGIVDYSALERWTEYFKPEDQLWLNSMGHHFSHYFFPEKTGRQIIKFWQQVANKSSTLAMASSAQ